MTYPIYPASTRFILRVDVYDLPEERFTVLDNVLVPLRGTAPLVLECVLNRLKLAGFTTTLTMSLRANIMTT